MDRETPDISKVLGEVLKDPEALRKAMEAASALKSSGALDGILKTAGNEPTYEKGENAYNLKPQERPAAEPESEETRRKRLLTALRPYLSRERQEKLDSVLRVLSLIETARSLGEGLGGRRSEE